MSQIVESLFIANLGLSRKLKPVDIASYIKNNGITHVVALDPPTKAQKEAMTKANVKLLFHDVEEDEETDWEAAWENADLQSFLKSFVEDESKAKKEKPGLLIACKLGILRAPFMMCCFLIVYRKFAPHEAMRLVDEERRNPANRDQLVALAFYKSSLPVLEI